MVLAPDVTFRGAERRLPAIDLKQQCTSESGVAPIQSISKCVEMQKALPYCQEQLLKECRYR